MMNKMLPMAAIIKFLYTHMSDYKPVFSEHADTVLVTCSNITISRYTNLRKILAWVFCKEKE